MQNSKKLGYIFLILCLIVGICSNTYVLFNDNTLSAEDATINTDNSTENNTVSVFNDKEYINIALFGLDNRTNGDYDQGNSDVIMICNINKSTNKANLISIYRDTAFVVDEDNTIRKVNYAYNHGGVDNAIATLNRNLDLDIEDYAVVDFYALVSLIDAMGGLELDITEEEVEWTNYYASETSEITGVATEPLEVRNGTQTLDGVNAVSFCRIRYTDGGDFKRSSRQRLILTKIYEKAKTEDILTLTKIATSLFGKVSTSLSLPEILDLVSRVNDIEIDSVSGFPFDIATKNYEGYYGWLDVPCTLKSNVIELHNRLGDTDYIPSDNLINISDYIEEFSGFSETDGITLSFD